MSVRLLARSGACRCAIALLVLAAAAACGRREKKPEPRDPAADAAAPSARPGDDPRALLHEAQTLLVGVEREGDASKIPPAIELLDKAEALDPADPDVVLWRGMAAMFQGKEADARAAAARLRTKTPYAGREPRLHFLNAWLVMRFGGEPQDALRELRQAEKLGEADADRRGIPRNVPARGRMFLGGHPPTELYDRSLYRVLRALAETLTRNRQADAAVQALREAARLAREWPVEGVTTRRDLAYTYQRAMRWIEAEDEWRALVDQYPGIADFRFGLGNAHAAQLEYEPAEREFAEVLRLIEAGKVPPQDRLKLIEARLRRANALRNLGRADEAKAEMERYVGEMPDDGRARYWLGMLYFDSLDRPDDAVPHFEAAHRLLPFCEEPLLELLRLFTATGAEGKAADVRREIEEKKQARADQRVKVAQEQPNQMLCL
jgi:tetratricopeptide (TPR) repeat protein